MNRVRSAASGRSNTTAATARSGRTNRTAGTRASKTSTSKVFEYPCNPCMRDNTNVEATNYCEDCGENLCADCVKQHLKFSSMKDHKILGKSDRRSNKDNGTAPKHHPMECSEHPGKKVDMFCADHNEVWCGACIAVNHRTCNNVMLIQHAAKGVAKRDECKETKDHIRRVKKELIAWKKRAEKDMARTEKQKATLMNKIIQSRKRIDKILDIMEKATILELERACNLDGGQMQDDTKMYGEIIASLDVIAGMLTASKGDTDGESTIFVGTKRANETFRKAERIMNFVRHTIAVEPIRYVPDGRIIDWLKSLQFLGTFSHQQKVYTGSYLERHDVSAADEYKDCDMFGSTILEDGRLMLTDWDNKKVKLLDTSYKVIDQLVLLGHPDDICSLNPQEAAVTMTMQKNVQFIKIVPKMCLSRIIYTDEHCRGITYHDGQIYVVCGGFKSEGNGKILVYTVLGEHVKTIERNNAGQRIFSCPIAVQVVSDGNLLYVTDGQRGIVTLTKNNDVVSVLSSKDVSWPCGICVDRKDNALICNGRSSNIIQVCGLDTIAVILTHKDGVKRPHSVCFDPNNLRIIMTSNKSKFISVFQLTTTSVEQVAEGAKVSLSVVDKKPKADNNAETNDEVKGSVVTSGEKKELENEKVLNLDTPKMPTLTEIKNSARDKSTNTVRNSLSKERKSDVSDQESVTSSSGRSKTNPTRGNLLSSRGKSASRESVTASVPDRSGKRLNSARSESVTAGTPDRNGKRVNSARNSRMYGRLERMQETILNNNSGNIVSRKNSKA
ncbi:uncharacterized protein LOC123563147 [Mercenaria mercenaria]|uniref:uncharacterized protein LOC123563147 n=1 Tax=Mercenaria mercenaria TaxID=6596 RepID=UPI00234ECD15|nr:uncharacterized protein LOC123563147 [Mercenaria mercenaria]